MTEEQKDILIAKILERPGELSDSEITQILEDDELRDIYGISVDVKAAKMQPATFDTAKEWEMLRRRIPKSKPWYNGWVARTVAIFVGVMFVSKIVTTMISNVLSDPETSQNPKTCTIVATYTPEVETSQVDDQTIRPLAKSRSVIAKAEPKLSQAEAEEVDEYLRVEQARIDNELASQRADLILNQYYAMAQIDGEDPQNYEFTIDDDILTLIMP